MLEKKLNNTITICQFRIFLNNLQNNIKATVRSFNRDTK